MAIAFDATSQGTALPGSSITFSHTNTGGNLVLLVGVSVNGTTSDIITGVTYNGTSMTQASKKFTGQTAWGYLYILAAPSSGTHDVVVSASSSSFNLRAVSVSYTGAKQTGQPDATGGSGAISPGTSVSSTVTTVANNCWAVNHLVTEGGAPTASTNVTSRNQTLIFSSMGDNNADITPGGSNLTQTWTFANQSAAITQVSIAPIPTNIKAVAGVAYANISKVEGVTIVNVKKISGLA